MSEKKIFYDQLVKIAHPLMDAAATGELVARMPIRQGVSDRRDCSHLEAVARLFCGLAPALELQIKKTDDVRFLEYIKKPDLLLKILLLPNLKIF